MRLIARIAAGALAAASLVAAAASAERAHAFEEGLASWYGGRFHGRATASGEIFDKGALTCAHRTLPFGTVLLVTNLDNGRQARLRVNDRGPFVKGRVLDASEEGARHLGYRTAGLATVRLEILGQVPEAEDSRLSRRDRRRLERRLAKARRSGRSVDPAVLGLAPVDPQAGPFTVQVGAFSDAANARRLAARLEAAGLPVSLLDDRDGLTRVRVGRHATLGEAERAAARLREDGLPTFLVRLDEALSS